MNLVTLEKIDDVLRKFNEKDTIKLKPFGIFYGKRVENVIHLKSTTHEALGKLVSENGGVKIEFRYKMRTFLKFVFFVPIAFLLLIFILPEVELNGNSNPSFSDKLIFVLVGLALIGVVRIIFQRGRKEIVDEVESAFSL